MDQWIKGFLIAGYRSFGTPQAFTGLGKVNLFIGQNNSGKSNVLRFLHRIYPRIGNANAYGSHPALAEAEEQHRSATGTKPFYVGFPPEELEQEDRAIWSLCAEDAEFLTFDRSGSPDLQALGITAPAQRALLAALRRRRGKPRTHVSTVDTLHDFLTKEIALLTQTRHQHLENGLDVGLIPAFRQIASSAEASVESDDLSGKGIIDQLAILQNPAYDEQDQRQDFAELTRFVRDVLGDSEVIIEVPHDRRTLNIYKDDRWLPIEALGTGIHEVVILAAAATVSRDRVLCVEEPEIHIHPVLQRKLLRYLVDNTTNQYFITTHSSTLMNVPGVEVFHVQLVDGESRVEHIASDSERVRICDDLGYRASDLLQANSVIWVEGPSDRIYLKYWLDARYPGEFTEGIDYSIMFFGGKLNAHISAVQTGVDDLIELRRLNQHSAILIDSDRKRGDQHASKAARRLRDEFDNASGPGLAWVTQGREVENYVPEDHLRSALSEVHPKSTPTSTFGQFDNTLEVEAGTKPYNARKVDVARHVVTRFEPDFEILDLGQQIDRMAAFVRAANQ